MPICKKNINIWVYSVFCCFLCVYIFIVEEVYIPVHMHHDVRNVSASWEMTNYRKPGPWQVCVMNAWLSCTIQIEEYFSCI